MKNIVLFKKIPRENKIAYLISLGMGVGMGVLMSVVRNLFSYEMWHKCGGVPSFIIVVPIIIAAIILLLILLKWFSVVSENINARIRCIVLMLISYIYIYIIMGAIQSSISSNHFLSISDFVIIPTIVPMIYFVGLLSIFFDSTASLLSPLIYSGVFIVIVVYLATKGITNLPKRIISSFLIGLFIYMVATFLLVLSCVPGT